MPSGTALTSFIAFVFSFCTYQLVGMSNTLTGKIGVRTENPISLTAIAWAAWPERRQRRSTVENSGSECRRKKAVYAAHLTTLRGNIGERIAAALGGSAARYPKDALWTSTVRCDKERNRANFAR